MAKRGPKALPAAEHQRRCNWRRDRHQEKPQGETPGRDERVSDVDSAAVLAGVGRGSAMPSPPIGSACYVGWDAVALFTLKHTALSATRLEELVDEGVALNVDEIHKEIASYVALVSILQSEQ